MSGKSPGLEASLRARLAAEDSLGFEAFMAAALYDPQGGYYAAAPGRTGRHGDFFTSVSVGPVFGRLLATQFAQMWRALGKPDDFVLVEQGAYDGQLMADILAALERDHPDFMPRAVIVEPLSALRRAQEQTLRPWAARLTWVDHEDDLPNFLGVFFANELLDAFPVKLLTRLDGRWWERRVGHDGIKFHFLEVPLTDPMLLAAAQSLPIPAEIPRFDTEFCPSLAGWMRTVASKLVRGWMLLVDYGHPTSVRSHPSRAAGSLAAYRAHQRNDDPLAFPGQQDLTAHVNFTAVAEAAEATGLRVVGFTDQHRALTALAAEVFPPMPVAPPDSNAEKEMRALRQLLHPESMGTTFKFLALAREADAPLTAFRFAREVRRILFSD